VDVALPVLPKDDVTIRSASMISKLRPLLPAVYLLTHSCPRPPFPQLVPLSFHASIDMGRCILYLCSPCCPPSHLEVATKPSGTGGTRLKSIAPL
jgi:hypothetical protein